MAQDELFSLEETGRVPEIILLDYQCTLCSNGSGRGQWFADPANSKRSFSEWIAQEQMRLWLLPLFSGKRVIMITARKVRWRDVTLRRIKEATGGWLPDESFFNPDDALPPAHKQRVILNDVFP